MKVKVRIAVAVNELGSWYAIGSGCRLDSESQTAKFDQNSMEFALKHSQGELAKYWIEAELEVPELKTVKGIVKNER